MDALLGPRDRRYFGEGFQRVVHHITEVAVHSDRIDGTVSATVGVDYPPDWSTKSAHPVAPHLSSVDAVVIAGQLAEAYLTHAHGLDAAARARMWLRAVEMKAGTAAQTHLAGIAVHGRRSGLRLGPWGSDTLLSTFDFRIGTVRLSCQVQHELGAVVVGPAMWPAVEDLLGPADNRRYGRGFARRRHGVGEVVVDAADQQAHALVRIEDTTPANGWEGMAAAYEPALSMVDATVCTAQLAQVLAYHLEQVDRAQTDTLWMRTFSLQTSTPPAVDDLTAMSGRVVRRRRVDRMRKSWRIYHLAGDIGAVRATASLAFNVPGAVTGAAARDGVRDG